jgi:bacteriocin biosynthesis cyclodehydratase domain-containing protein
MSELALDLAARGRGEPVLRPGAEVLEVDDAKLHVALANHSVTFTGVAVVRGLRALVAEMGQDTADGPLEERAARAAGLEPGFVAYLLSMLAGSRCLYWPEDDRDALPASELERYFASVGESPAARLRALRSADLLVVTAETQADTLRGALAANGLPDDVLAFPAGTALADVERTVGERAALHPAALIAWGFPYDAPVSRLINALAMRGVPALFASCEGAIGRIGPFAVPRATPCLECLNSRLLSNAGGEAGSRRDAYRLRHAHVVPESRPAHPSLLNVVTALLVLEIEDIVLARPPRTLGGILELSLPDRALQRREVLKAPYCDACAAASPPRFAWDVRFESPVVKNNGAER